MEKRTKIILAGAAAVLVIAGTTGIGMARSGHMGGFMKHDRHAMVGKIFDRFDTDKDGAVSKAEVDALRKAEIAKHDANKDGKISLQEFETLWVGYMRERMVDHFQKLDDDGDAQVTEDEIARPLNTIMSWLDRNNDEKLTKDELRKGHRWGRKHRYMDRDDDDDRDDD